AIFHLHSGEVLLALLAPYFALFCVLQRRGMDIVRSCTGSAAAAALFGAILFGGVCLVIFPITLAAAHGHSAPPLPGVRAKHQFHASRDDGDCDRWRRPFGGDVRGATRARRT